LASSEADPIIHPFVVHGHEPKVLALFFVILICEKETAHEPAVVQLSMEHKHQHLIFITPKVEQILASPTRVVRAAK
jgi:hypothetical protein